MNIQKNRLYSTSDENLQKNRLYSTSNVNIQKNRLNSTSLKQKQSTMEATEMMGMKKKRIDDSKRNIQMKCSGHIKRHTSYKNYTGGSKASKVTNDTSWRITIETWTNSSLL